MSLYPADAAYRYSPMRQACAARVVPRWSDKTEQEIREHPEDTPDELKDYPNQIGWYDPAADILSIMELRRQVVSDYWNWLETHFGRAPTVREKMWFLKQASQRASPQAFYYGLADCTLYHRLKVVRLLDEKHVETAADELNNLVLKLCQKKSKKGILLSTCSGGGKTVACDKVYHDCTTYPIAADWNNRLATSEIIEELKKSSPAKRTRCVSSCRFL